MTFGPQVLGMIFGGALALTGVALLWLLFLLVRDFNKGELW